MSDNIIRKIKGLLAKAESSTFEGERESFMQKANELIVKHAIDLAMLADDNRDDDRIITYHVENRGSFAQSWTIGYNRLSSALGVTVYYTIGGRLSSNHTGVIVGYKSDVDNLVMLHTSLTLQATTAMKKFFKENGYHSTNASERYRARREFLNQFFIAASKKIEDSLDNTVKETAGAEVALRDRFDEVVGHAPGNLVSSRSRYSAGSAHAANAGRLAGSRADVGQTRVSGTKKAISS